MCTAPIVLLAILVAGLAGTARAADDLELHSEKSAPPRVSGIVGVNVARCVPTHGAESCGQSPDAAAAGLDDPGENVTTAFAGVSYALSRRLSLTGDAAYDAKLGVLDPAFGLTLSLPWTHHVRETSSLSISAPLSKQSKDERKMYAMSLTLALEGHQGRASVGGFASFSHSEYAHTAPQGGGFSAGPAPGPAAPQPTVGESDAVPATATVTQPPSEAAPREVAHVVASGYGAYAVTRHVMLSSVLAVTEIEFDVMDPLWATQLDVMTVTYTSRRLSYALTVGATKTADHPAAPDTPQVRIQVQTMLGGPR